MPKINNRAVLIHTAFFKVVLSKSRANPFPRLWRGACACQSSLSPNFTHPFVFPQSAFPSTPLQRLRGIYKSISLPPFPEQATNARQYNNRAKEKKMIEKKKKKKHRRECVVGRRLRKIACCNPRRKKKGGIAATNVEVAGSKY